MALAVSAYRAYPPIVAPPVIMLSFRLLRDGIATPAPKTVRVYRDWTSADRLAMIFRTLDGEHTEALSIDAATLLDQSEWLVAGLDRQAPRRTRAAYLTLDAGGEFLFNIAGADGGGGVIGTPALMPARVRVDGVLAARDIVVLEKPSDGEWRLAGFGPTTDGAAEIDVRVTDGNLYAMGLDDWGVTFTADLAVTPGQTIRPSVFAGWLYRITEAGTLPAAEPQWWAADGDNASRPLGTARAIAVRYYQPLAHGPLTVEML